MEIKSLIDYAKKNISPVDGKFPQKPYNANTWKNWLLKGMKPIDIENGGTVYQMKSSPNKGYKYFATNEVVPMSEEELAYVKELYKDSQIVMGKKEASPEKKKNLAEKVLKSYKNIIAIKVEATGFYPDKGDEMLSISIVGDNGSVFEQLLKPTNKKEWKEAEQVNRISPEMVRYSPYPEMIKDYVQKQYIDKADGIIFFNAEYNLGFLTKGMGLQIPEDKVIDAYEVFVAHKPFLKSHKLGDAIKVYIPSMYNIYEAKKDARGGKCDAAANMAVYMNMSKVIRKEYKEFIQEKDMEVQHDNEERDDR